MKLDKKSSSLFSIGLEIRFFYHQRGYIKRNLKEGGNNCFTDKGLQANMIGVPDGFCYTDYLKFIFHRKLLRENENDIQDKIDPGASSGQIKGNCRLIGRGMAKVFVRDQL